MRSESKYIVLDDGDIYPREQAPAESVRIRSARRDYQGEGVATVKGADWVTNYFDACITRKKHCPLVPVTEASDLAWYLHDCDKKVFVERDVFLN